jgi:uncharacterized protein YbjQ (UPF0145 family)
MNKFIITTTGNIEGCPIKNYLGVINSNIVIGTNYFLHKKISIPALILRR